MAVTTRQIRWYPTAAGHDRRAGCFFWDDCLIRPAQDCSGRYGRAVVLNRVDALNEHSYAETPIGRIDGSALPGNRGTHNGQLRGRPRISGRTHEDAQRNGSEPGGRRLSLEEGKKGRVRLLLIGPLPAKSASLGEPIGGSRMTFAEAVRELDLRGFDLDVINTARPRPNLPLWKILSYEFLTFARGGGLDSPATGPGTPTWYSFTCRPIRALSAASTIWALCRVLRRPLALRFFGDSLYFTYHRYGPARRWLMDRTCLRASLVYEERWTPPEVQQPGQLPLACKHQGHHPRGNYGETGTESAD